VLVERLAECDDQDYFERGIELAIEKDGMTVVPFDIGGSFAVEVDFAEDLARANRHL
jgi:choline kinase